MDVELTHEQSAMRKRLREWLSAHLPPSVRGSGPERFEQLLRWHRELYEGGWVGMAWPREYGGAGRGRIEDLIVCEELARFHAPEPANVIGIDVVGPAILQCGTPEQRARFLPDILSGQGIWCQGFSEPDAGSDLQSLRTKARKTRGGFILSGQKVWTSWAEFAGWCAVLARTGEQQSRGHGISFFAVDMTSPGVLVKPIVEMTGEAGFSEVFFDQVFVPEENLIGPLDAGWSVAWEALLNERGPYVARRQAYLRTLFTELRPLLALAEEPLRQEAASAFTNLQALRSHAYRMASEATAGRPPGVESSVDKVFASWAEQQLFDVALDLFGTGLTNRSEPRATEWLRGYLYSRAATIYGGTTQIQLNLIGERILDLPRARR